LSKGWAGWLGERIILVAGDVGIWRSCDWLAIIEPLAAKRATCAEVADGRDLMDAAVGSRSCAAERIPVGSVLGHGNGSVLILG